MNPEKKTDPVCGVEILPMRAVARTGYEGEFYYFCSRRCLHKFRGDPKHYLTREPLTVGSQAKKPR